MKVKDQAEAPDIVSPPPAPGADGKHPTFCRNCEAFCGLEVEVKDGVAIKIMPDRQNPHSRGHACVKGTAALGFVYDPDRILRPLRRTGGPGEFEPVGWDEAMSDIARRMAEILREGGGDAVANYMGNPSAYNTGIQISLGAFHNHFGIWKKFAASTQDVTSRLAASHLLYGTSYRLPIPDLPRCDMLLIFGGNPMSTHGSILTAPRISEDLDAIAKRGRVIVFDPRRTETAARFEHVRVRPDSDTWLLMALLNVIFEADAFDEDRLDQFTTGLADLRQAIRGIGPEQAEPLCGVPAERIREIALAFAATPRAAAYGRVGICRGRHATLANVLLDALNVVAGKFGVEGGWVFGDSTIDLASTRPSAMGPKMTRFGPRPCVAGYLHFSQFAEEILTPGTGRVRALLVQSGNMVLSAPGSNDTVKALEALDLFVSNDLYINETNRHAHYILPGNSFLERNDIPLIGLGHMVRPAIQYTAPVIPNLGDCRNEAETYTELAARLHALLVEDPGQSGYDAPAAPRFDTDAGIEAMLAIAPTTLDVGNGPQRLTLDLLKAHPRGIGVAENLICTNSLEKVAHADGRIHLWGEVLDAERDRLFATPPAPDGGLRLFGMRRYQTMNSWMHNIDRLVRSQKPALLIHPDDAAARGIGDGDRVTIASSTGQIEVTAKVTDDVVEGSVCYPHGYGHHGGWQRANAAGGANINLLADPKAGDLFSASSHLDGIDVVVRPIAA